MAEENNNIIRKISWNTSCYNEVNVNQFQGVLSNWTNRSLARILDEIFVDLVPKDETLYIDKLEIDIGSLELNCLEEDLSSKVSEELKKQFLLSIKKNVRKTKLKEDSMTEGIFIKNAGIVLINTYFPILFERLQITTENKFNSIEMQQSAVHYLQFVATGINQTEEDFHLPLNKILCGLQPTEPLIGSIDISDLQVNLITGMITAIINHWSSIGNSSVDGFRSNWLLRDGILKDDGDKWVLNVEKKEYDILIERSPFSFSIINYPWMQKPLHVNWI